VKDSNAAKCERSEGSIVIFWWLALFVAILCGFYFRLIGLGKAPLSIDEYFSATSIGNILKYGLPEFECGGYYVRGLLLQYISIPFVKMSGNEELGLRLVTVFFNILTVPAIYYLAKQVGGRVVACAATILFCFSVWEVEFARFARMYSPFQALFMWYLVFLYKVTVLGDERRRIWMYLLSFACIFVHEGAIFLIALNFLPLVFGIGRMSRRDIALSLMILTVAMVFVGTDFRHMGPEAFGNIEIPESSRTGISGLSGSLPPVLATTLVAGPWLWIFLLTALVSVRSVWISVIEAWKARTAEQVKQTALLSALIGLAFLNQFGLVVVLLVLGLMLEWMEPRAIRHAQLNTTLAIGLLFVFWVIYTLNTSDWLVLLGKTHPSKLKDIAIVFVKYPNIDTKIFWPWFRAMPWGTAAIAFLVIVAAWGAISNHGARGNRLLFVVLLGSALLMCVLPQPYKTSRYTFFLYPLVLILVGVGIVMLAQALGRRPLVFNIISALLMVSFAWVSEDFNLDHLVNIDSDRVMYRMQYPGPRVDQYYQRWDFRAAAQYVNERSEHGDLVVTTTYVVPHYLDRLDYFYRSESHKEIRGIAACQGERDRWTNARLIYDPEALLNLLRVSKKPVWLVVRSERYPSRMPVETEIGRLYASDRVFRSIDGHIDVFRIESSKGVPP
jgi:hypothetical protein